MRPAFEGFRRSRTMGHNRRLAAPGTPLMRLLTALLLALSCVLTPGCASSGSGHGEAKDMASGPNHAVARDHAYTRLLEIRLDDETQVSAYLVQFDVLPQGVIDERPYPVGTALVQDTDLNTLGFLTPKGQAFRFDDDGRSHSLGFGARHQQIALILGPGTSPNLRLRAMGAPRSN